MDQRVARALHLLISQVLYFKSDADCATGAKTFVVNSRSALSDMTFDILGHALSCDVLYLVFISTIYIGSVIFKVSREH